MSELKSCPFCASKPIIETFKGDGENYVHVCCYACGVEGPKVSRQKEKQAIEKWNRRIAPPATMMECKICERRRNPTENELAEIMAQS